MAEPVQVEPTTSGCALTAECDSSQTVLRSTLVELSESVSHIVVDDQYVFLANTLPAAVYRFRRSDGDLQTLYADPDLRFRILDLALTASDVVWLRSAVNNWMETSSVDSMPKDGGEIIPLVQFSEPDPMCERIAVGENRLYCAQSAPGAAGVYAYDIVDGGPPTELFRAVSRFHATHLVRHGDVLVWLATEEDWSTLRIGATPADGSETTILATGTSYWGMTVHGGQVYVGNEEGLWSAPIQGPALAPLCVAQWSPTTAGVAPIGVADGQLWYLRCPTWNYNGEPSHTEADRLAALALEGGHHQTRLCAEDAPELGCGPATIGAGGEIYLVERSYQHSEIIVVAP